MKLRKQIQLPELRSPAVVILSAPDEGEVAGKFIVGRSPADAGMLVLAFDTQCTFHKDIGARYGLRPMGGGWCEINHSRRDVWLSGRSTQFGKEPDRRLTLALYRAALPEYRVEEED
jgi:hypothetical protein